MAAVSTFETVEPSLSEMLSHVGNGRMQLPNFQRGWVWDDDHIRDLLASVSRSFPIGTVMQLATGGEVSFSARPIEGADPGEVAAEQLVLDGQQRLTSLFQALASGRAVKTQDAKGSTVKRWYYIDIQAALDDAVDREDAIISVPEDRRRMKNFGRDVELDLSTPEAEFAAKLFPLSHVFDHYEWAQGFREHHGHAVEWSRQWDRFEREVVQSFRSYKLPVIRLTDETPKEAVCLVFEKVNTGGIELSVFELLTATFAAVAPSSFQLREDWERRQEQLAGHPVLAGVASTDLLQTISLLVTHAARRAHLDGGVDPDRAPAISCKRRDLLRLSYEDYAAWADRATKGFEQAARFLHRERVYDAKFLPYGSQVVPLAALLAVLGDDGLENPSIRNKLVHWYWCGVFGELYGAATETRFAQDVADVLAWVDGGSTPRTVTDANFPPDRLVGLRTRNSAAYKGLYALLVREGARDFRTGEEATDQNYFDEAVDIHHIFPRQWCQRNGVNEERCNSIVNKTPLTSRTNRIIGARAPSHYLRGLRENHGVSSDEERTNLASHLIDPQHLATDDFGSFFQTRRTALLQVIAGAMGKSTP